MEMQVIMILLLNCCFQSLAFLPEIQMPYKAVSWESAQITTINSTLTCNENRTSTRDCAIDCYKRELNGSGCPGFYRESLQGEGRCYICHASTFAEIQLSLHIIFNSNNTLYLLNLKSVVPEMSVNFDNYTDTIVYGKGTTGIKSGVVDSDHVDGIKDKALYLHGGGKVSLTGLEGECWTNLDHCTSGVTMSIWFKPLDIKTSYVVSTGGVYQSGLSFLIYTPRSSGIRFMVTLPEYRYEFHTNTQISINQ